MNSLQLCDGLITKKRKTEQRYEESVLDLFLVCDKMFPFVTKLDVNVQGNHQLTNLSHKGRGYRNRSCNSCFICEYEFPNYEATKNRGIQFQKHRMSK